MYEFTQNKEKLEKAWNNMSRKNDFKYRSNNWLKIHRKPMRRKPFKQLNRYVFIDEAHLVFSESNATTYVRGITGKGKPFFAKYQKYKKSEEEK